MVACMRAVKLLSSAFIDTLDSVGLSVCFRAIRSHETGLLDDELTYAETFAPKRLNEFCAGRVAMRSALRVLGDFANAPIGVNEQTHAPILPEGVLGSISHSARFVFCCAARSHALVSVGVDVEDLDRMHEDLFDPILTPEEMHAMDGLDAVERIRQATLIFSAKESFYKFQHPLTQKWLDFHDMSVFLRAGIFTVVPKDGLFKNTALEPHDHFNGIYESAKTFVATAMYL